MSKEFVIREGQKGDETAIYELSLIASKDDSVPELFKNAGDSLISRLGANEGANFLIVFKEDEAIGVLDFGLEGESCYFIKGLYVRFDFRRRGVGSLMLEHLENLSGDINKIKVIAVSEVGLKFWKSQGYDISFWNLAKTL